MPALPPFVNALSTARSTGRPLLLDGGVGTELANRGVPTSSPVWSALASLEHPDMLRAVHEDYASAGARIITTNTFRTTARAFERAGVSPRLWRDAAREAVRIAKQVAGQDRIVAGSVAPLEDCFNPTSAPAGQAAYDAHRNLMECLADSGVDILWLETFGTVAELFAAGRAAQDVGAARAIPFAMGVTTTAEARLISEEPLVEAIALAVDLGASVFNVNCIPVGHVAAALPILRVHCPIATGIYANLGHAEAGQDWRGSAHMTPSEYSRIALGWHVDIVGGCCGSAPAHIRAIHGAIVG